MHDGSHHLGESAEPTVAEIGTRNLAIMAACTCGHARVVEPSRVCVPPTTLISDVGRLLRCSKCNQRGLTTRVAPRVFEYRPFRPA